MYRRKRQYKRQRAYGNDRKQQVQLHQLKIAPQLVVGDRERKELPLLQTCLRVVVHKLVAKELARDRVGREHALGCLAQVGRQPLVHRLADVVARGLGRQLQLVLDTIQPAGQRGRCNPTSMGKSRTVA